MNNRNARQDAICATVHYQGLLCRIVGRHEENLTLPGESDLKTLLSSLVERYGPDFERALLTPAGELRPAVGILVNGLNPARRGGLSYRLEEDNSSAVEIALLGSPPVGG